ncbi:MAG: hypothetical protein BGO67_12100 [Alphaproteobacteria bacterium 41-28]|nr:MAG: hypothetical protein BGO67_12100 [Alphaproteobacteria bacterium 41-28]
MADNRKVKLLKEYNQSILPRLQDICEPLKIFDISNFAYGKITKDQKFFRIGTHEGYTELFFKHDLYNQSDCYRGFLQSGSFSEEKRTLSFLWTPQGPGGSMRMSVDMWNGISFYQTTEDYIETWAFGGTLENSGLAEFYLNNLDLLKRFLMYFKNAAKDIIDLADKHKTIDIAFHDKKSNLYKADPEKVIEFNKKILTKRYCLSTGQKEFNLTLREIECLLYKSQGFTAKKIARKCDISPRTVETHFNKILFKSGLDHMNQLIYLCKEEGLL